MSLFGKVVYRKTIYYSKGYYTAQDLHGEIQTSILNCNDSFK